MTVPGMKVNKSGVEKCTTLQPFAVNLCNVPTELLQLWLRLSTGIRDGWLENSIILFFNVSKNTGKLIWINDSPPIFFPLRSDSNSFGFQVSQDPSRNATASVTLRRDPDPVNFKPSPNGTQATPDASLAGWEVPARNRQHPHRERPTLGLRLHPWDTG